MSATAVVLSCLCGAAGLPFSPTGRLPARYAGVRHGGPWAAAPLLQRRSQRGRARPPLLVAEDGQWGLSMLSLRTRRALYQALEPLDKGDFRWEFLVPWNNKTLTTLDKFVVCSTFIGLSFTLQTVYDPGASVGVHLSYIAQFFSYAMGDPIGFRLLAVLTAVLEIGGAPPTCPSAACPSAACPSAAARPALCTRRAVSERRRLHPHQMRREEVQCAERRVIRRDRVGSR